MVDEHLDLSALVNLARAAPALAREFPPYQRLLEALETLSDIVTSLMSRYVHSPRYFNSAPSPESFPSIVARLRSVLNLPPETNSAQVLRDFVAYIPFFRAAASVEQDVQLQAANLARGLVAAGALEHATANPIQPGPTQLPPPTLADKEALAMMVCTVALQLPNASHTHAGRSTLAAAGARVRHEMSAANDVFVGTLGIAYVMAAVPAAVSVASHAIAMHVRSDKTSNKALGLARMVVKGIPPGQMSDALVAQLQNVLVNHPSATGKHLRKLYLQVKARATPAQITQVNLALDNAARSAMRR